MNERMGRKVRPSDIFLAEYHPSIVSVSLAWNSEKSVSVEETDGIGSLEAEAMAIGRLWQEHGQEIIEHIRRAIAQEK